VRLSPAGAEPTQSRRRRVQPEHGLHRLRSLLQCRWLDGPTFDTTETCACLPEQRFLLRGRWQAFQCAHHNLGGIEDDAKLALGRRHAQRDGAGDSGVLFDSSALARAAASPPFLPAARASADVNSWAWPARWAASPPWRATSRRRDGGMLAKPRLLRGRPSESAARRLVAMKTWCSRTSVRDQAE
jgi:hypothetical protein